MIERIYRGAHIACAAAVLLLSACGGGGGGGGGSSGPDLSTAPGITVSPTSLSFVATHNGALPPTQGVQITISQPSAAFVGIAVPAANPPTWLDYQNQGRLTGSGNNWTFTAAILSTSLAPGTYTTTVQIGIADAGQNILAYRNLSVSYTVQPLTGLGANPTSLSFSQLQGAGVPSSQTLGITELGGASYAWNAAIVYQSGSGWLTVNGATSASGATLPTSLTVGINTSPALGTLNALIRVTGNGNTLDLPVSYTVTEPAITRAPASLTFNASSGQGATPATQDVTLSTQGNLPLNYTTSVTYGGIPTGWLTVPASGTAPSAATVGVSTTNLAPGTYTATLFFNTAAQTISVGVSYVVATSALTLSPSPVSFTITPASVSADRTKTVTTGTTGAALNWTAASSETWVTVSPTGSSWSSATLTLDSTQLDTLEAGTRSATITFSYTPPNSPATSAQVTVNLDLQLPKVNFVSPYVQLPNTTTEVILRGSGFTHATGNIMFDTTPVSVYTVVSDTEIRVFHPTLGVGSYPVKIPNQLNLARTRASLVIAAAPTFTALPVPTFTSRAQGRIVYDAERVTAYTNNVFAGFIVSPTNSPRIERNHLRNGGADTDFIVLPTGAPNDVAITPDGKELIAVSDTALYHIDLGTWSITQEISIASAFSFPLNTAHFRFLAMGNDGNALVFLDASPPKPFAYNVLTRTFTPVANVPPNLGSNLIAVVGSLDGSRILIGAQSPANVFYYDASIGQIALAIPGLVINRLAYDRTGAVSIADGVAYDRGFTAIGSGGINFSHPGISPDGTRGYGVLPGENPAFLHTFDLTSPVSGVFPEIGAPIALPDVPGDALVLGITPDGHTVFVAGEKNFVVQPVP